jgi:hypothetical protein
MYTSTRPGSSRRDRSERNNRVAQNDVTFQKPRNLSKEFANIDHPKEAHSRIPNPGRGVKIDSAFMEERFTTLVKQPHV